MDNNIDNANDIVSSKTKEQVSRHSYKPKKPYKSKRKKKIFNKNYILAIAGSFAVVGLAIGVYFALNTNIVSNNYTDNNLEQNTQETSLTTVECDHEWHRLYTISYTEPITKTIHHEGKSTKKSVKYRTCIVCNIDMPDAETENHTAETGHDEFAPYFMKQVESNDGNAYDEVIVEREAEEQKDYKGYICRKCLECRDTL